MAGRLPLVLPVRVKGINISGEKFTEESLLKDICHGGAWFPLRNEVNPGDVFGLLIDPERSAYKGQAMVVRQESLTGTRGYGIGVRFSIEG